MMRVLALAAAAALVAVPPAAAQATLDPTEQRLVAYVRAHRDSAIALLQQLVDVNSGTLNVAGVRRVGELLAPRFERLGFRTRWEAMPAAMARAGHLYAERSGPRGRRLLLIGHLDTVFEPDSPLQRFERMDSIARGPGVSDMKGGDVVIVLALEALASVGALEGTTITVALTGDEERPGAPLARAREGLIEAARRSDVALDFENGVRQLDGDYASTARRSSSTWRLAVRAPGGHSSGIFRPGTGSGAIYEAARILTAFHEELRDTPGATFSPGVILGGTDVTFDTTQSRGTAFGKPNVVAAQVVVEGDLRTRADSTTRRLQERMRAIVARSLPRTSATIEFLDDGYPAMTESAEGRRLMARLSEASEAIGYGPVGTLDPDLRGAGDISFVAPFIPGLAGLGVMGTGAHSDRETVDLRSLERQAARAAVLLYRLTRESSSP